MIAPWDDGVSCTCFGVIMTLTPFLEYSLQEYFSYIIWGRNSKFGVWMHLWMVICCLPLWGHCYLDLWPSFKNSHILKMSPILFKVGITNLVCGLFLGWRIGAYYFVVNFTLTLTSDLFLSPHFFSKASGILQSPPAVRPFVHPSRYLLLNHWTKSNLIWCVSC